MDLSIIVPVYNEEQSISEILKRILRLRFNGLDCEVVVVDDGSVDMTPRILKDFKKESRVTILTHIQNLGKGAALRTGLKHATGSIIAFQDSDLEYNPDQLPGLIKPILDGEYVVYGSRFIGTVENMRFLFYWGNRILNLLTNIIYRTTITDMETGYKIFRKEVLNGIELKSTNFDIEPELTAKILRRGFKIKEVPIHYIAREKEEKKITIKDGISALFALIKYRLW